MSKADYERGFDDGFILRKEKDGKPWVGLTDDEINKEVKEKFVDYNFMSGFLSGASFAEAKLKEKNKSKQTTRRLTMYKYIRISAVPAPLDAVLDDGSEYTRGVARETALAESAPALAKRVEHLEWLVEAIRKADEAAK